MKIEKLNDHEIRCTLSQEDLASRHLKLSELAYGNEKTKRLFRDMMQQAAFQFGFDAENTPLMVEAVPISADCIVVSITKVDDPDELDTRFSKFAPSVGSSDSTHTDDDDSYDSDDDDSTDDFDDSSEGTDEDVYEEDQPVIGDDRFDPLSSNTSENGQLRSADPKENIRDNPDRTESHSVIHFYSFDDLRSLIELSDIIPVKCEIKSSLYKNRRTSKYLLIVSQGSLSSSRFNNLCIQMSEYLTPSRIPASQIPMIEESYEILVRNNVFDAFR